MSTATQPYTHCVQATFVDRFMDCQYCHSQEEAEQAKREIVEDESSWIGKPSREDREAMTRIVPIEQANCYDRLRSTGRA